MGYYLSADFSMEFTSPEAVIEAAKRLGSHASSVDAAWDVIDTAWRACGEEGDFHVPEALKAYGWSSGKWYSRDFKRFTDALVGLAHGIFDFSENEGEDRFWRERLHADGTVSQHPGKIVYEGDEV